MSDSTTEGMTVEKMKERYNRWLKIFRKVESLVNAGDESQRENLRVLSDELNSMLDYIGSYTPDEAYDGFK